MQPIAGESPPELGEAPIMTVWPTIGSLPLGRWIGRLASIRTGWGPLTIGLLVVTLTIPLSLAAYSWLFLPGRCRRYAVTTRRVVIRRGWSAVEEKWISLDDFDRIVVDVRPGQQWLRCGDVVFCRGSTELLRLAGVRHPEVFRRACLKVQMSLRAVGEIVSRQLAVAAEDRD